MSHKVKAVVVKAKNAPVEIETIIVPTPGPNAGSAAASGDSKARDRPGAEDRKQPERRLRTLASAQNAEDGRCERQETDENDGVRRRNVLERKCGQQRETNDDADRPHPAITNLVEQGRLGRKTGRGWYDYQS